MLGQLGPHVRHCPAASFTSPATPRHACVKLRADLYNSVTRGGARHARQWRTCVCRSRLPDWREGIEHAGHAEPDRARSEGEFEGGRNAKAKAVIEWRSYLKIPINLLGGEKWWCRAMTAVPDLTLSCSILMDLLVGLMYAPASLNIQYGGNKLFP